MKQFELFEAYLGKKLTPEEVNSFESKLKSNPDFKEDFVLHKNLQHSFDILLEQDVLGVIDNIEQKKLSNNNANGIARASSKKWISLAASTLFLLTAYLLWPSKEIGKSEFSQISEYIHHFKELDSTRGTDNSTTPISEIVTTAKELLEKEEWIEAIPVLKQLIAQSSYIRIKHRAEWNLAVVYAQINEKEKAKDILLKIMNDSSHDYKDHPELKSLMKKLR